MINFFMMMIQTALEDKDFKSYSTFVLGNVSEEDHKKIVDFISNNIKMSSHWICGGSGTQPKLLGMLTKRIDKYFDKWKEKGEEIKIPLLSAHILKIIEQIDDNEIEAPDGCKILSKEEYERRKKEENKHVH